MVIKITYIPKAIWIHNNGVRILNDLEGTGGNNGFAIITNQGSAPSITGGGSFTGRTLTSTNPT